MHDSGAEGRRTGALANSGADRSVAEVSLEGGAQ